MLKHAPDVVKKIYKQLGPFMIKPSDISVEFQCMNNEFKKLSKNKETGNM